MSRKFAVVAFILHFSAMVTQAIGTEEPCDVSPFAPSANPLIPGKVVEARTLRQMPPDALKAYVLGSLDAFVAAGHVNITTANCGRAISQCLAGSKSDQWVALVRQYVEKNPRQWNENAAAIVYEAVLRSCIDIKVFANFKKRDSAKGGNVPKQP